jgi:hypothetical protein
LSVELITGNSGGDHISAADFGGLNIGVIGPDDYVLTGMSATKIDNNTVRVSDGEGVMQGRHFRIGAGGDVDVTIENGSTGYYRYDIIVAKYEKGTTEAVTLEVIKGTPTTGTPSDPTVTEGDIPAGDTEHEMALFRVNISEFTIDSIDELYNTLESAAGRQAKDYRDIKAIWTRSSDATLGLSTTPEALSFDNMSVSDDEWFEITSTSSIKVKKDAEYEIGGMVGGDFSSSSYALLVFVYVNGAMKYYVDIVNPGTTAHIGHIPVLPMDLSADDYVQIFVRATGTVTLDRQVENMLVWMRPRSAA